MPRAASDPFLLKIRAPIRDHQGRRDRRPVFASDPAIRSLMSYLPLILLTLAMAIGIPLAYRAWREAHTEEEAVTDTDVLSGIEAAYAAGEIDEAEFRRVRELLSRPKGAEARPSRPVPKSPAPLSPPGDAGPSEVPSHAEPT
jgi:hypothetical protein